MRSNIDCIMRYQCAVILLWEQVMYFLSIKIMYSLNSKVCECSTLSIFFSVFNFFLMLHNKHNNCIPDYQSIYLNFLNILNYKIKHIALR